MSSLSENKAGHSMDGRHTTWSSSHWTLSSQYTGWFLKLATSDTRGHQHTSITLPLISSANELAERSLRRILTQLGISIPGLSMLPFLPFSFSLSFFYFILFSFTYFELPPRKTPNPSRPSFFYSFLFYSFFFFYKYVRVRLGR